MDIIIHLCLVFTKPKNGKLPKRHFIFSGLGNYRYMILIESWDETSPMFAYMEVPYYSVAKYERRTSRLSTSQIGKTRKMSTAHFRNW